MLTTLPPIPSTLFASLSVIGWDLVYQGLQAKLNYHQMQQDGMATTNGSGSTVDAGGKVVKNVLSSGLTMRSDQENEEQGVTLLSCYTVTLLPCYTVLLLRCYPVTLLSCYTVLLLPCYPVTHGCQQSVTLLPLP